MKRFIIYFLVLAAILSCNNDSEKRLSHAEQLLDKKPQEALEFLSHYSLKDFSQKKSRAHYALLKTIALHKNYIDVQSDSLSGLALDYYRNSHDQERRMKAWFYHGIVQKNAHDYMQSIISLERALREAYSMNDQFHIGLINQQKSALFCALSNNPASIECQEKAIEAFEKAAKSEYATYSLYSLGIDYFNNKDFEKAQHVLLQMKNRTNNTLLRSQCDIRLAAISVEKNEPSEPLLDVFRSAPHFVFDLCDYGYYAICLERTGLRDSSDYWISYAYQMASSKSDSASIDYMRSRIEAERGNYKQAFSLVDRAAYEQELHTRSVLQESLNTSLKNYYQDELSIEETRLALLHERNIWVGITGGLFFLVSLVYVLHRLRAKDRHLKELMAQSMAIKKQYLFLHSENASLIGSLFSERIHHLDLLSEEYFHTDEKGKKDIVFNAYKKYLEEFRKDTSKYSVLENDLNKYCNEVMIKFDKQVPDIKGENRSIVMLFFAGLPYYTILLLTKRNSIASLKMLRSRIRNEIKKANAPDAQLFLEMLEMKRQKKQSPNNLTAD